MALRDKLNLNDVGKTRTVEFYLPGLITKATNAKIVMGIKAPNGDTCFIFDSKYIETQAEVVRQFVEGHIS